MHKHNIIQNIKLVNIKHFILSKKVFFIVLYDPIMYIAYCMILLTRKLFQVCEMCASPCYICLVDVRVNIKTVKN